MAISYKKLFHVMIEKGISNSQLQKQAGFSANIITRLKRNEYVSLESIESICRVLNCKVDDILEFVPDQNLAERMWMDRENMGTYDFININTE